MTNKRNLVLGGDVHNTTRPDANSVLQLRKCADALHDAGLRVMAIQGQHDFAVPSWASAVSENIEHVDGKVFEPCDGIKAYGLDNLRDPDAVKAAVSEIPKEATLLVCHQMFREVFNMEGVWNIDTAWLPAHIKYALVGDFHEPVTFKGANNIEAWYSGSLYMCKLDEPPQKSFLDVGVTAGGEIKPVRIPLKSRRFDFIGIKNDSELKTAAEYIAGIDRKGFDESLMPVVVVNYMATVSGVAAALTPLCGDKILWLRPVTMRIMEGVKDDADDVHKTMSDCLPLYKESVDSDTYALLTDLLSDDDTQGVLSRYKEKILPEVENDDVCNTQ